LLKRHGDGENQIDEASLCRPKNNILSSCLAFFLLFFALHSSWCVDELTQKEIIASPKKDHSFRFPFFVKLEWFYFGF
jgi:hypothetical protein